MHEWLIDAWAFSSCWWGDPGARTGTSLACHRLLGLGSEAGREIVRQTAQGWLILTRGCLAGRASCCYMVEVSQVRADANGAFLSHPCSKARIRAGLR